MKGLLETWRHLFLQKDKTKKIHPIYHKNHSNNFSNLDDVTEYNEPNYSSKTNE